VLVEEVEAFLGALPGVGEVAVAGLPHDRLGQVVAAVVVPGGPPAGGPAAAPPLAADLRRACRALPAPARPRRWLTCAALPRTPAGKVDRAAVAAALAGLPGLG
jgi:long-chain acyl-CoA synthetase